VFAASSLGGAAREQFAAIEAGGVAVEAPHTQINVSTPEEVLFFGTAAAAQKRERCAQLMEARS
jgi:hypothetical protein